MKLPIKKLSLFLVLLPLFSSINTVPTINAPLQNPLAQAAESNACDQLLQQLFHIVEVIDYSLEHMAQVVNNNQVRGIEKREVLPKLLALRKLVAELKKQSVVVKKENVASLAQITHGLLKHLRDVINSGLQTFPVFEPAHHITRSKHVEIHEIAASIQKQIDTIKKLESEAQNVGLSFVNKAFRTAERFDRDHKILFRTKVAALMAFGASLALYHTPPRWIKKLHGVDDTTIDPITGVDSFDWNRNILTRLKQFVGYVPNERVFGAEKLSELSGYYTDIHHSLGHIFHIFPTYCAWNAYEKGIKSWWSEQKNWVKGKRSQAASIVRGGQIKKPVNRFQKEPRITFDDVIGNEHAKETLMPLVHYLLDHEKYDRSGIVPGTGILLMGPPRTGKTYMAEALGGTILQMCREMGLPEKIKFYSFTAADLKEWGIVDMLKAAQLEAPVIIFIDELDTGGFQREADARSLCQLMTAMSELNTDKSKKVVLMGATNKPQNLDYALLEPGRFGTKIQFHYPSEDNRNRFIKRELENRAIVIDDRYIDQLAHQTKNCPFDEIFQILTRALQRVKSRGTTLTESDLERAYDEVVHKIVFEDDITIPEDEEQLIAIHNAGQALARVLLETKEKLVKVTSLPVYRNINEESVIHKYLKNQQAGKEKDAVQHESVFKDQKEEAIRFGKVITASPTDSLKYITADEMKKELQILLSGFVAEQIINGSTAYLYNQEAREQALNIAKFLAYEGVPAGHMSKAMKEEKLVAAHTLLKEMETGVMDLLTKNKRALLATANALHEERLLSAEVVQEIAAHPENFLEA